MGEMKDLYHQQDCLAQEDDKAEKEWERMCNWVHDLRSVVKGELERLEQDLSSKEEELAQLEATKKDLEASSLHLTPVVSSSVSELSKGASAGPSAHKKKKKSKQN